MILAKYLWNANRAIKMEWNKKFCVCFTAISLNTEWNRNKNVQFFHSRIAENCFCFTANHWKHFVLQFVILSCSKHTFSSKLFVSMSHNCKTFLTYTVIRYGLRNSVPTSRVILRSGRVFGNTIAYDNSLMVPWKLSVLNYYPTTDSLTFGN